MQKLTKRNLRKFDTIEAYRSCHIDCLSVTCSGPVGSAAYEDTKIILNRKLDATIF